MTIPAPKLSEIEIEARLRSLPGWAIADKMLRRAFSLKDFPTALVFVGAVGHLAEMAGHHPDITINYNRVTLTLVTHDSGGLTEKDFALAASINRLPLPLASA